MITISGWREGTDSAPMLFSASTTDYDRILLEPSSYPSCNAPSHHPDSTLHTHDVSTSITLARAVPHDHDNTTIVLSSSPDSPSSSSALLRVDENGMPSLNHNSPKSVPSRGATRGSTETSAKTMHIPTPNPRDSPSAIRGNVTVPPDLPPLFPLPRSVSDVAIASPSHGQHNIA
jgi:hypothetical protein